MFDFKDKLSRFIAGGSPSQDTLRHYNLEIDNFLNWCKDNAYDPLVDVEDMEAFQYLDYLNGQQYSLASINLKISAAKTFYHVANKLKLISSNPFASVKPKRPTYDDTDFSFFDLDAINNICQSIMKRGDSSSTRDLAIVMLMAVEGLRTVEIHRMCDSDINFDRKSIFIHGKGKDSYIYPCQDTWTVLEKYLKSRPEPQNDEYGTPTFIGFTKQYYGARISRNGIRWSINHILLATNYKTKGNSCHTLRHSCGTNLYAETKDLRLVQETLRHSDPSTTSRYAHVTERLTERKTENISPFKDFDISKF